MNKLEQQAHDTLAGYEAQQRQRGAAWFPPAPRAKPTAVWSPRMTEQQQRELAEHIAQHNCPF